MPSSRIFTTDGPQFLQKDVQQVDRRVIEALSWMEYVNKMVGDVEVRCMKCGQSFLGRNNDPHSPSYSVVCGCRELRHTRG